jgi:hypothetical protein
MFLVSLLLHPITGVYTQSSLFEEYLEVVVLLRAGKPGRCI